MTLIFFDAPALALDARYGQLNPSGPRSATEMSVMAGLSKSYAADEHVIFSEPHFHTLKSVF
jgi:hypothetical protein